MYEDLILAKLNRQLGGLREGKGLVWLDRALRRLKETGEPGLQEIVHAFTKQMGKLEMAEAFLLEIRVADGLLDVAGPGSVYGNRTDGYAINPCDVTMIHGRVRADVQCKAVMNATNDLPIAELEEWLNTKFGQVTPGVFVEIQCNTAAGSETMMELKKALYAEIPKGLAGQRIEFVDSRGTGIVELTFTPSEEPGVHVGMVWSSSDTIGFAQAVDDDANRAMIRSRIAKAKKTFGFDPSPTQFNLVAMTFPSLALLSKKEIPRALYGTPYVEFGPDGMRESVDGDGLFSQGGMAHCSGIVHVRWSTYGEYENVIYPHPRHAAALVDYWTTRPGFSVARTSS